MRKFYVILIMSMGHFSYSAELNIDSLQKLVKIGKDDTLTVNNLNLLSKEFMNRDDYSSSMRFARKALGISVRLNFLAGRARSHFMLAVSYKEMGDYASALRQHFKSLAICKKLNNKRALADSYNSIGDVYNNQGKYPEALKYFILSLKTYSKLGDKGGMAWAHNNIGVVLTNQNNLEEAARNYKEAVRLANELNEKKAIAWFYNNLGNVYVTLQDYTEAMICFQSALANQLDEKLGGRNLAYTYNNIGSLYFRTGDHEKALVNYGKALLLRREVKDKNGIAWSLTDIGSVYLDKKKYSEAVKYYEEALIIAEEIGQKERIRNCYEALAESYYYLNNTKKAYEHHVVFSKYQDSLLNEEKHSQITEIHTKYETQKKEQQIKLLNREKKTEAAVAEANGRKKNIIIFSVLAGLLLLAFFAVFIFRSLRVTSKQKIIIEEKQRDILDSINYAKYIQQAILPDDENINKLLPRHFILYLPKDIVAGDFYFVEEHNGIIFAAAADCTGHGVPGAMVSVVCSNALNRAVKEFGLTDAGDILDKTNALVLETLGKKATNVKDGMDISLVAIKTMANGSFLISWAGANNPLWYISNEKLIEIKPNKQPIGKTDKPTPFTSHAIDLKSGDSFYLFTDGFADQFGGEKGKKFKYSNLQKLLLENSHLEPQALNSKLQTTFDAWKGDLEQIDDICIIGVRV
ncbi:MAG: tetratricopeptide repeat protein [Flavobacteriales bacterium]